MALLRSIWSDGPRNELGPPAVREEYLTAGFVRIAVAVAHMVVQERRAAGQLEACVSDVGRDLKRFTTALWNT